MKVSRVYFLAAALLVSPWSSMMAQDAKDAQDQQTDPYQWLEEVGGEKALEWVKARNAIVQKRMEGDGGFDKLRSDLLEILDSNARIPFVSKSGDYFYNFWRDRKNERGLWRRTTLSEYRKAEPAWEILLDLDALGKSENENWVWKSVSLLRPDYKRALVSLRAAERTRSWSVNLTWRKSRSSKGAFISPKQKGVSLGSTLITSLFRPISGRRR